MTYQQRFYCACKREGWIVRQSRDDGGVIYCVYCDTTLHFLLNTIEYSV